MKFEWKPGDIALVTSWRGTDQVALRVAPRSAADAYVWVALNEHGDTRGLSDGEVMAANPLVLINPEDRDQVERIYRGWCDSLGGPDLDQQVDAMQTALRGFASPTPPKPDEPATWGVVKAACVHSDERRTWMRHEDGNWYVVGTDTKNNPDDWDSLVDPEVIREGVQ